MARPAAPQANAPPPSSPPTPVFRPGNPTGAIAFGVRTFLGTLSAESPGHGFQLAMAHYRNHLKHSEEEEEKRYRAMQRQEADRRGRSSG